MSDPKNKNIDKRLLIVVSALVLTLITLLIILLCKTISDKKALDYKLVYCFTSNSCEAIYDNISETFNSSPILSNNSIENAIISDGDVSKIRILEVDKGYNTYNIKCLKYSEEHSGNVARFSIIAKFTEEGDIECIEVY